jgi:hypothetical protein
MINVLGISKWVKKNVDVAYPNLNDYKFKNFYEKFVELGIIDTNAEITVVSSYYGCFVFKKDIDETKKIMETMTPNPPKMASEKVVVGIVAKTLTAINERFTGHYENSVNIHNSYISSGRNSPYGVPVLETIPEIRTVEKFMSLVDRQLYGTELKNLKKRGDLTDNIISQGYDVFTINQVVKE